MAASEDNMNMNGDSYQKQYDGTTGVYREIPNGAGDGVKKKWMISIALLAVLGIVYSVSVSTIRSNPKKKNVSEVLAECDYSSNNTYPYVNVAMVGNSMMFFNDFPRLMGTSDVSLYSVYDRDHSHTHKRTCLYALAFTEALSDGHLSQTACLHPNANIKTILQTGVSIILCCGPLEFRAVTACDRLYH
jgi:hypothetical protein